jgi:hypothetical protein
VAGGAVRRRSAPPVAAWPLALAAKEPSRAAKVQGSGRLLSYFGHQLILLLFDYSASGGVSLEQAERQGGWRNAKQKEGKKGRPGKGWEP